MNALELYYCIFLNVKQSCIKKRRKNYFSIHSSVFSLSNGIGLLIEDVNMEQLSAMHLKWSYRLDSLSVLICSAEHKMCWNIVTFDLFVDDLEPACMTIMFLFSPQRRQRCHLKIITIACTTTASYFQFVSQLNISR